MVHIQGGEVTGSIDEKVRHAITKLSDIHFVSTNKAYERVISMGENPDSVYVTGCPSIDIAKQIDSNSPLDFNPFEKYGGVGNTFNTSEDYLIVMQHPITTEHYLSNNQTLETLEAITKLNMPTFWFWPNPDAGSAGISKEIRVFREHHEHSKIHFVINMSPEDFLKLTISSSCIIGNSSVAIRECSFLGVPAVNLGTRQFGRERGSNVIDSSHDSADIISAVKRQLSRTDITQDNLYGDGTAGEKIASILSECKFNISKTLLL